jgi:hypothetical protein
MAHTSRKLVMCFFQGTLRPALWMVCRLVVQSGWNAFCVFTCGIFWYAFCVWILWWQCTCCCWRIWKAFSDWWILSQIVLTRIHRTLCDTGSLPCVSVQIVREDVWMINKRENILEIVQRSPCLSNHRMASHMGILCMQVWWTLHDEEFYPYHDQRVQAHPELLSVILFSDDASFIWDGVNNSQNVHTWSHNNPHEIRVMKFRKRFSVNAWCGVVWCGVVWCGVVWCGVVWCAW